MEADHGQASRRTTTSTVLPSEQDDEEIEVGLLCVQVYHQHGMGMATHGFETTGEHVDILRDSLDEEDHSSEPCESRRSARQNAGQHSNPNRLPRATNVQESFFFFFRVLHTIFPHLRAHALARSVTVARSSAVQASSSRRQERRWPGLAFVCRHLSQVSLLLKLIILHMVSTTSVALV